MRSTALVAALLFTLSCGTPPKPAVEPIRIAPVTDPKPATDPVGSPVVAADPVTPLDPQIKRGTLPNGVTYYVVKHKKPEQRAALWLAVNAGAVLEDDDQRGLAHFVEHMAFNGTKRFPKQQIVDFIEKSGMRFGADVNAYTAFDQTVYQLLVPTDDQPTMLKGLDVLRDWSNDISFEPDEVEKERGVVLEEWRLGRGADARIFDKQFPIIFAGSKYAQRLPIGQPEIIKGAARDTLVRFYKDWYQPQNMAVIAVGDFDATAMEAAIASRFGDLKKTPGAKVRPDIAVPHDQPLAVTIETDKEMPYTQISIYDKIEHFREETKGDYRRFIVDRVFHSMVNARFAELGEEENAAFVWASSSSGSFVRAGDMYTRSAGAKENHIEDTLTLLFREMARVQQHGFLASELARAVKQQLASAETDALEWEKNPSPDMADEITRHFFEHEQMPGRAVELEFNKAMLPTITLAELNAMAKTMTGETGRVIAISAPVKTKLPTVDQIKAIAAAVTTAKVDPWVDDGADKPLIATPPTPGRVTKTESLENGVTKWTLANGVRVLVKPTTFQNDQVMLTGFKKGGSSLIPDKSWTDARFAAEIVSSSGVGEFDAKALRKVLAGKQVYAGANIGELAESVNARGRAVDVETMLQLLNQRLVAPRKDVKAFNVWKAEQAEYLRNRLLNPEQSFFEQMTSLSSSDHLRYRPATVEMIGKVDLDRALAIYKDRFADLGDFTFVIVGNLDLAKLEPMVESYLGSLPSKGKHEMWKDIGVKFPAGKVTKTFSLGSEPKSFVYLQMSAPDKWSIEAQRDATILAMVLDIKLREVLREDMGGVYGVEAWAALTREPTARRIFGVFFGCDPVRAEALRKAVFDEVGKIAKGTIGDDYITKVSETLKRTRETDRKENWWWMNQLRQAAYYGDDFKAMTDIDATIARVTKANVQAAAARYFDPNHYVLGVMTPVVAKPATK